MKKTILGIALGMVAMTLSVANVHAESYSKPSTIKNMTVGTVGARVELSDNTGGFEACSSERQWYWLDLGSADASKEMYATLLNAKTHGQKVFLQLMGCFTSPHGVYSKVTHVYVCDNKDCL